MAHIVIDVDPFDPSSVAMAQKRLDDAMNDFDKKVDEFLFRLAAIGQRAAQGAYGNAIAVTVEKAPDGFILRASGDAVVFFEFGAGSRTDPSNRFAKEMPFEVRRGSFSDSKNPPGPYARSGYRSWEFAGVRYEYVEPRNGMEKAFEAMIRDVQTLAKAVFG